MEWHESIKDGMPKDKSNILVEFRNCPSGCDTVMLYAAGTYKEEDEDHYRALFLITDDFITLDDFYKSIKRWAYIE